MVVNGATPIREQSFAELDEGKTESSESNQTPVSAEEKSMSLSKLKKHSSIRSSEVDNNSTSKRTTSSIRSSIVPTIVYNIRDGGERSFGALHKQRD